MTVQNDSDDRLGSSTTGKPGNASPQKKKKKKSQADKGMLISDMIDG